MGVKLGLKMTHDLKIQQTCMIFMLMIQHWEIFALDKNVTLQIQGVIMLNVIKLT